MKKELKYWFLLGGLFFIAGSIMFIYWGGELGQWEAGFAMGGGGSVIFIKAIEYIDFKKRLKDDAKKEAIK
ncbi:MAG: hypothetical protein IMZ53_15355 [Thermoplasmata archaeon]|nr:hypothetical protein [Thermoplasmata archaeon]